MPRTSLAPFQEILVRLLRSIMSAQADVLDDLEAGIEATKVADRRINRHFCWLAIEYEEGVNRHLFDAGDGISPLRVDALRDVSALPAEVYAHLSRGGSLPEAGDNTFEWIDSDQHFPDVNRLVQRRPTRISRLIKSSFSEIESDHRMARNIKTKSDITIKSPLNIAWDYLTIPEMPGSRAFAALAIRNLIFELNDAFPSDMGQNPGGPTFTPGDLETAYSHIVTSFRTRYWSKGADKLPANTRSIAGAALRQYLACRGILWWRFKDPTTVGPYLRKGNLRDTRRPYEFDRPYHLERLPEIGEVINELWGLPIPMRGADTIFRGGLRFSSRKGLVLGLHGGPGTGKTSIALGLGACLSAFDVPTLFISSEETQVDLLVKAEALVPDDIRRLSFFPENVRDWLIVQEIKIGGRFREDQNILDALANALDKIRARLADTDVVPTARTAPKPCRAVVVLDGVHDLLLSTNREGDLNAARVPLLNRLRDFVSKCKEIEALVILTTGEDWGGDQALDYLVEVAMRLSYESLDDYGKKPDRRIRLTKARHQLCSIGVHGVQIAGDKGVRFSPQINYQLDRRAIWRTRIPEMKVVKPALMRVVTETDFRRMAAYELERKQIAPPKFVEFYNSNAGVRLFRGANIFLNGEGSGAKAALAMKIAMSPSLNEAGVTESESIRILVVSFLYPEDYYAAIVDRLVSIRYREFGGHVGRSAVRFNVIHLYPGFYTPDQLFNRVEWELEREYVRGTPYTAVVVDGIHNVFLQFPEIEKYTPFWPQLYASLRSRELTIISTHTTFVLQGAEEREEYRLDDKRSEPLRHALVQKTDFRFEIDPVVIPEENPRRKTDRRANRSNIFNVRPIAAINQPIPGRDLFWSRDLLVLFEPDQTELPFPLTVR